MNTSVFDLTGKTALVTGGNAGIGFGIANSIAEAGGDLVIWGRRPERNEAAAQELRGLGVKVLAQTVDVADYDQVAEAFDAAVGEVGDIYGVVANAGIARKGAHFHEMPLEDYADIIAVNQFGVMHTFRAAAVHMVERAEAGRPGGSLIGIGSITGAVGVPDQVHYTSAKGAMEAMIRALAVEYGAYGVRVNCLAPGMIRSEIREGGIGRSDTDDLVMRRTTLKRWGTPADVGGPAVYLMSDAAAYHTGDVMLVDGGWTANGY